MKLVRLAFWSAVAYGVILVLISGALPAGPYQTITLLGIPLIIISVFIARDLARQATHPKPVQVHPATSFTVDPVQFLSDQIRVAMRASDSFYDGTVRARLKELLINKAAIEKGLTKDEVRLRLSDPKTAAKLLHDNSLYKALLGPVPKTGGDKVKMINSAIDMIGEWKA